MIQPIYFFYFMSVGVSMPFFSPYLRGLGLSGRQIATILAIAPLLNMGVPLFWAWTADRTRRHARILSAICLGAFCGYAPLLVARTFWPVLGSYLVFGVFSVGIGSLVDSVAIARVRQGEDYGRIRVWGSVGYMASAIGVGALLTLRGGRAADIPVPSAVAAALLATFLATLQHHGAGEAPEPPPGGEKGSEQNLAPDRRAFKKPGPISGTHPITSDDWPPDLGTSKLEPREVPSAGADDAGFGLHIR